MQPMPIRFRLLLSEIRCYLFVYVKREAFISFFAWSHFRFSPWSLSMMDGCLNREQQEQELK